MKVSRILHAGYIFEHEFTKIAFDPIFENPFSGNCYAFPSVKFDIETIKKLSLNAVFISHFHDDHCSLESLDLLDRETPIYIYCVFEELFEMVRTLGFQKVYPLELDVPVKIGEFEVLPLRALDKDVDSIFHIRAGGLSVLNVVDSWIDPETLNMLSLIHSWDLVLWPFQTMREIEVLSPRSSTDTKIELPEEWIDQLKRLNPRFIVPSSCQFIHEQWSWYNMALFPISYKYFEEFILKILPKTTVLRLNPSEAVELKSSSLSLSDPLAWIHPVGDQNVDYTFDPNLVPPTTSEIARRFAPVDLVSAEKVYDFCRGGLLEKYRELDPLGADFFNTERIWKLSIYDHNGNAKVFWYRIFGNQIETLDSPTLKVSWATEIALTKLYSALELGEALTSLYMQINVATLGLSAEPQFVDVDVIEDPLIRCLYSGQFGAYQRAQLKRLQSRSALNQPDSQD